MRANLDKQWPQDWKRSVFIPMQKNVQNTIQLHSFHMLARLCSKSSKLGFSNTWTKNLQIHKLDLEKAEEPEIKLPASTGSQKKQENSRKTSTSASLTTLEPLTVWITTNWKILKELGIPDHLTCLLRNLYAVKKQQLEPDMEKHTGSKLGKEYIKAVYCTPWLFNICRVHHMKCQAGWITSWNQNFWQK